MKIQFWILCWLIFQVGAAKAALARALQKIGGFEVGGREGRGSRQLDDLTIQLAKELAHGIDLDEGLHAPDPEHIEKVEEAEANAVSVCGGAYRQLQTAFFPCGMCDKSRKDFIGFSLLWLQ